MVKFVQNLISKVDQHDIDHIGLDYTGNTEDDDIHNPDKIW